MKLEDLNHNDRYSVKGHSGVAFYFHAPEVELVPLEYEYVSDAGEVWPAYDYGVYEEEITGKALMVMVGDDREWVIDPENVAKLDDNEYCPECGQIGCTAYAGVYSE